jgi:hypothetical protein
MVENRNVLSTFDVKSVSNGAMILRWISLDRKKSLNASWPTPNGWWTDAPNGLPLSSLGRSDVSKSDCLNLPPPLIPIPSGNGSVRESSCTATVFSPFSMCRDYLRTTTRPSGPLNPTLLFETAHSKTAHRPALRPMGHCPVWFKLSYSKSGLFLKTLPTPISTTAKTVPI